MWACKKCGGQVVAMLSPTEVCKLEFKVKKNGELGRMTRDIKEIVDEDNSEIMYWCDDCYEHSKYLENIAKWK